MSHNNAFHSTYLAERMGSAVISPDTPCEAGSMASFELTYTAGYFGIDDTGSLKIVHRFASDMGKMQVHDPQGWNYVSAEASNGAVLELRYEPKGNIRPWDKTLLIRVQKGFLREGDQIVVRIGDRRHGSNGIRVQTFVEPTFEFKVLVDAFATYNYVELPQQPSIAVVAGPPVLYKAILPTQRRVGEAFGLGLKGEDKWGNPCDQLDAVLQLQSNLPVEGLPAEVQFRPGQPALWLGELRAQAPGELVVTVRDSAARVLCSSNPLRIDSSLNLSPYWADLHGQSEETICTNSAEELITFARDVAFLDAMSHQGNDFQITTPFWQALNRLTAKYNEDGRFIIFPGYEWSGNTGLGGDRNVMFKQEGRQIHRSHHALVEDLSDVHTDANSAADLFEALKDEDCVVFAHIGGRYADIKVAHYGRIERSAELHSDWGTFEWLLEDAFDQGYRVGVLANSDGHKGRHGASHPWASLFGAYGGLSCLLATSLSRDALFEALRRRHHYATTGTRAYLATHVHFEQPADLFSDDPQLGGQVHSQVRSAMMGDILRSDQDSVEFQVEVSAGAPIERIEIRNRTDVLEVWRPYQAADLGRRLRIIWEGSEYRGRGRQTVWDGSATFEGNAVQSFQPINLWNIDKTVVHEQPGKLSWRALTTGGFGGVDLMLDHAQVGTLQLQTGLIQARLPIDSIGLQDQVLPTQGGIKRQMRVFRLPECNPVTRASFSRHIQRRALGGAQHGRSEEDALYVCVTLEDGHLLWSSPIYLLR